MADEQQSTLEEKLIEEEAPPAEADAPPKKGGKKTAAVQKASESRNKIRVLLDAHKGQFELALADTISTDKFTRVALTEILGNEKLMEASVPSLMGSLLAIAQLGLEPGGPLGQAHLVPFGGEVVPIIGYKGMEQLAYRSGMVASINARVVRDGDFFDYEYGTNEHITHRPKGGASEITHAYCVARLVTGGTVMIVLERWEVDEAMAGSPGSKRKDSPWKTHFARMARKTAIRRLFPDLPSSTETSRALGYDERVVTPQDIDDPAILDVEGEEV